MMGDLVLLQSEVGPAIEKLQAGGFEIMAIHNHLIDENPRVMYLHYMGEGDPAQLAKGLLAGTSGENLAHHRLRGGAQSIRTLSGLPLAHWYRLRLRCKERDRASKRPIPRCTSWRYFLKFAFFSRAAEP